MVAKSDGILTTPAPYPSFPYRFIWVFCVFCVLCGKSAFPCLDSTLPWIRTVAWPVRLWGFPIRLIYAYPRGCHSSPFVAWGYPHVSPFWSLLLGTRGSFGFSNYPITKLPDYPIGPTPSPRSQRSQYLLGFRGGYHNDITIFIGLERFAMHKTQYPCGFPRFRPHNFRDHSRQLSISKGLSGFCFTFPMTRWPDVPITR